MSGSSLAVAIDPCEVLALADTFVRSRPEQFSVEAVFVAWPRKGGIFTEGLACRIAVSPDGRRRICVQATGELLAESAPGQPLHPAANVQTSAMSRRAAAAQSNSPTR